MKHSRIITFEGTGFVSNAISVATRSNQSHVAWQTPDGTLWEAVEDGFKATPLEGDDQLAPFRKYHPPGVRLHFFEYHNWCQLDAKQEAKARLFLQSIQDQPYGFRTLFTFMLNPNTDPEAGKVICSEAVLGASIHAGRPLVERIKPWNCAPSDIYQSPVLKWLGSETL